VRARESDSLGGDPHGDPFNSTAFTRYSAWEGSPDETPQDRGGRKAFQYPPADDFEMLWDCTTCHDTPNVGKHSFPLALDIGAGHDPSDETDPLIANGVSQLSFPELPIFIITGCPDSFADPTSLPRHPSLS
jgi:cytochrome c peroxidase